MTLRCIHGLLRGLCVVEGCTHWDRGRTPSEIAHENGRSSEKVCWSCGSLAWRVEGKRCKDCGLKREREESLHAIDFGGVRHEQVFPEGAPRMSRDDVVALTKRMEHVVEYVRRPMRVNEVTSNESNVVNTFFKDETGNRYGSCVVVARCPNISGQARWLLRCDCGAELRISGHSLRAGKRLGRTVRCPSCSKAKGRRAS